MRRVFLILGIACILAFYAEHVLDGLITLGTLAAVLSSPYYAPETISSGKSSVPVRRVFCGRGVA